MADRVVGGLLPSTSNLKKLCLLICAIFVWQVPSFALAEESDVNDNEPLEPVVSLDNVGNNYTKTAYALAMFGAAEYQRGEDIVEYPRTKKAGEQLMVSGLERIEKAQAILQLSLDTKWFAAALQKNLVSGGAKKTYAYFGLKGEDDGILDSLDIDTAFAELVAVAEIEPDAQKTILDKMKKHESVYEILGQEDVLDIRPQKLEEMASGKSLDIKDADISSLPDADIFQSRTPATQD